MMAMNWPISPTEGQIYTPVGGPTYVFNSPVWKAMGQGQIAIVSDDAPASPANGQLWWESDTGILFIWVNDGNSSQWVQCGGIQEASDLSSVSADMSIGFRTSGNRFVVNDKADLTGTDVMAVAETGNLSTTGSVTATTCYATAGQFIGSATANYVACGSSGGTVYLRPNGWASTTGQTSIASSGLVTTGGQLDVMATAHGTGAVNGVSMGGGIISTSKTVTTATTHHVFYTPNGTVGYISTNASATTYNTSSDERLKEFSGPLSGEDAIAVIRADPVRRFTWIGDGTTAVGWGAQTSYAVSSDLASPPPEEALEREPGDEGFHPWGMDQSKRTPYLWAALTHALDEIEALKARIAVLEGGAS
jgi:hypothetical protein